MMAHYSLVLFGFLLNADLFETMKRAYRRPYLAFVRTALVIYLGIVFAIAGASCTQMTWSVYWATARQVARDFLLFGGLHHFYDVLKTVWNASPAEVITAGYVFKAIAAVLFYLVILKASFKFGKFKRTKDDYF